MKFARIDALTQCAGQRVAFGSAALLGVVLLPGLAALAAPVRKAPVVSSRGRAAVGYNRDVRPILSENCFQCHGPDRNTRMAGLRLDIRDEALSRKAIVPGHPQRSRLVARILEPNPGRQMPPVKSHKKLTPEQKELLRRWVAEGAAYEPHWAFVPLPARVPVPPVKNAGWCRSPIDRFVLSRLEAEGLRPSPEAGRAEWLRRVSLDLTGLLPTPQEVDAFAADRSPNAYETVVDRLLASPRYGERMALPWLDVARYADSYGYQSDQLSPTWPYRDWVVRAFNDNLPYDQFITWQLAGDLLPETDVARKREQRLATAFNRLHRMTNEGGSVPEEWRLEGVADRVHTFGTAFLGLTLECARCHDHKFDPVSQRDYYAISAFFNSIDEHGMYDRADIVPSPSLLLPAPDVERAYAGALDWAKQAEAALARVRSARESTFQTWLAEPGTVQSPDLTGRFDFERFDGAALPNGVAGGKPGARLDDVPLVEGRSGKAAQLDGENNVHFPELGRFTRHTPYTIAFWMWDSRAAAEPCVVYQACSGTDAGPHGYDLMLEQGRLSARMFRHWPGNAIGVRTRTAIPKDTWTHVAVTYDGSSRAGGLRIYLNGKPAEVEVLRDHMQKGIGQHTLTFGQRFRDKGFKGGRIDDLALFDRAVSPIEVAHLFDGGALAEALADPRAHEAELREYYLSAIDSEFRKASGVLSEARMQVWAREDQHFEVAVMEEMPRPRPTYVLDRGRYDAPKTDASRVNRDSPRSVLPFPASLRRDRLGLAQWLTRRDNPLTGRVAVNRFWALLFGNGLVDTPDNFGLQGRLPSHPELLDWLAGSFTGGASSELRVVSSPGSQVKVWDVKSLIRLIVLSSTYRQASALRPELKERDPDNVLLARGPSFRLSAEAIRDVALAASGLLDERLGGPPVSPYQPGDLWRESNVMSPPYRQSVGKDLYRRSLYSVWKRTAPPPNMLAFDAVSREVCVAQRQTTSTPLQALVLLNDPQFVEAARVLGERTLKDGGTASTDRVRFAFRQLASRAPTDAELGLLVAFYDRQRAHFAGNAEAAAGLLKTGERKPDPALPPAEVAAATALAQTIMNLDATVWKR